MIDTSNCARELVHKEVEGTVKCLHGRRWYVRAVDPPLIKLQEAQHPSGSMFCEYRVFWVPMSNIEHLRVVADEVPTLSEVERIREAARCTPP